MPKVQDVYIEDQDDLMVRPIGRGHKVRRILMDSNVELIALAHSS
jgi:hypothetical protein